jgi:hypothetical protein
MMKLIEMAYNDQSTILVAVDVPDKLANEEISGNEVRGFLFGVPEKVDEKFNAVSDMILKCSIPIVQSFKKMEEEKIRPQKATAEFGLSFNATGNIYLVGTSMEGSIKVSFEWDLGKKAQND